MNFILEDPHGIDRGHYKLTMFSQGTQWTLKRFVACCQRFIVFLVDTNTPLVKSLLASTFAIDSLTIHYFCRFNNFLTAYGTSLLVHIHALVGFLQCSDIGLRARGTRKGLLGIASFKFSYLLPGHNELLNFVRH